MIMDAGPLASPFGMAHGGGLTRGEQAALTGGAGMLGSFGLWADCPWGPRAQGYGVWALTEEARCLPPSPF